MKSSVWAVKEAMRRIRADPEAMRLLHLVAPGKEDLVIGLVAQGEYWWRQDDRLATPKRERDKSRDEIGKLAGKLAEALRETPWPGLALQEIQGRDGRPTPLADYLEWLASFAMDQDLDLKHLYPPGQSTTDHRQVMLRNIKDLCTRHDLLDPHPRRMELAMTLARAVLADPSIEEEVLRKV